MQQWVNLFAQVAKPVLKTLAYAGATHLLEQVQTELKQQQKQNTQSFFKAVGVEQQKVRDTHHLLTYGASILDFEPPNQESELERKLLLHSSGVKQQALDKTLQVSFQLPKSPQPLKGWPLYLSPEQLLHSSTPNSSIPLRIIISPPQFSPSRHLETQESERQLSQRLRYFLNQYYPLHSPIRATEFLGGVWDSQSIQGEGSIKALFLRLKQTPTLILESEIQGDTLNFRCCYWGFGQEHYRYETLCQLPYKAMLEESAKLRAIEWREIREQLLALGKTPEEVNRLGGNNAVNLSLLEEAETLQEAGINLKALTLDYQFNEADFAVLGEFLGTCHCLVAGWLADLHYLLHRDISPQLPQWLPQVLPDGIESTTLQSLFHSLLTFSNNILGGYQKPKLSCQITLKLAQSLLSVSASSLAKQQISDSLKLWLQTHQLSRLEQIEELAHRLGSEDLNYLETLKQSLLVLGEQTEAVYLERFLHPLSLPQQTQFVLAHTWPSFSGNVTNLTITPDGRKLVSSSAPSGNPVAARHSIELWELEQGKGELGTPQKLVGFQGNLSTLALSPDGRFLVGSERASQRSYLKIWNLQTGKLQGTLLGHKQPISALEVGTWKKDRERYLIASGCRKIKLWDLQTGQSLLTLFGHRLPVNAIAISPDGQLLLSGSEDRSVRLWNLRTGELIRTLTGHQGSIRTLAITPDGHFCVSGSDDQTIRLWDLQSRKLIKTLIGHTGAVRAIAISPDGQFLISGGVDKTIKVWDILSGKALQTLSGHRTTIRALAVSPDGQTLASGCEDKTIKTWQLKQQKLSLFPICKVD